MDPMTSTDQHQDPRDASRTSRTSTRGSGEVGGADPAGTPGTGARAAEAASGDVARDEDEDMARDEHSARDEDSASAGRADELEGRWRRAAADLENLRKRFARDAERDREAERDRTAAAWLPVLDHLELALTHADADPRSIVAGVRAVRDQAVGVLDRLGYPRHDEVGVPFDPARHEVLSVVEEPEMPPGTVVAVVRPGYGDAGRQLRPVGVAVSRPPADEAEGRQGSSGVRGSLEGQRRRDDGPSPKAARSSFLAPPEADSDVAAPPAADSDSYMARESGPGGRKASGTAE